MNCFICHKPVGHAHVSLLEDKIKVHIDCFYNGLPAPKSNVYADTKAQNEEREKAIEARATKLIQEYLSSK